MFVPLRRSLPDGVNFAADKGCITLCDVLPAIKEYPPTLLVAGTRDVLIHSSRRAFAELRAKGCQVSMMEYDARHAFFGLPPGLNSQPGAYLNHAAPALEQILNFLDDLPWMDPTPPPPYRFSLSLSSLPQDASKRRKHLAE